MPTPEDVCQTAQQRIGDTDMKDYRQIKHRLSKEEQEGMSNLLTRLREKRIEATGVNESFTPMAQHELRDEGHRTV